MSIKEINNIINKIRLGDSYEDEKFKVSIYNKELKIYKVENLITPNKKKMWVNEKKIVDYLKKL